MKARIFPDSLQIEDPEVPGEGTEVIEDNEAEEIAASQPDFSTVSTVRQPSAKTAASVLSDTLIEMQTHCEITRLHLDGLVGAGPRQRRMHLKAVRLHSRRLRLLALRCRYQAGYIGQEAPNVF